MKAVVLDAGALIAVERRSRRVGKVIKAARIHRWSIRTSAAVVAQVWRNGRQANVARVLAGVNVLPLDQTDAHGIGRLLGQAGTADVVDGHVAWLVQEGDTVLTGDAAHIRRLLDARGVGARVLEV